MDRLHIDDVCLFVGQLCLTHHLELQALRARVRDLEAALAEAEKQAALGRALARLPGEAQG